MREEGEGRRGQTIVTPTSWGWLQAQGDKNATDGQILELSEIYSLHNIASHQYLSRVSETPHLLSSTEPKPGEQTLI